MPQKKNKFKKWLRKFELDEYENEFIKGGNS